MNEFTVGSKGDPNKHSIIPAIFSPNSWKDHNLFDEIKDYRTDKIDYGRTFYWSPKNTGDTPSQLEIEAIDRVYFKQLLEKYYSKVIIEISTYSSKSEIKKRSSLNAKLDKFIIDLKSRNFTPRFYTTNYDRLLQTILSDKEEVFDGFDIKNTTERYDDALLPNIRKIASDDKVLNYYNLHGSVYWAYEYFNEQYDYQFICTPTLEHPYQEWNNYELTNPGQSSFISNIITGYNKIQRLSLSPLNHMYQSFTSDLFNSDMIICIGFSFSDPYINRLLKDAIKLKKMKVLNVTYAEHGYLDDQAWHKFGYEVLKRDNDFSTNNADANGWIHSSNSLQHIYTNGFEDFLLREAWNEIL